MRILLTTALFILFQGAAFAKIFTCPHYSVSSPWDTRVTLYNPQRVAQTVTVTAYDRAGEAAGVTNWTVPAAGGLDDSLRTLFPDLANQNGWFEIDDPSGTLEGQLNYVFQLTGAVATVPLQEQRAHRLVFPMIQNNLERQSGFALTNPNLEPADVRLTLKFNDGRPADTATISLAPGQKVVSMMADTFANVPERGQLVVEANVPVSAVSLGVGFAFLHLTVQNPEVLHGQPERRIIDYSEVEGGWRRLGYGGMMEVFDNFFALFGTLDGSCAEAEFQAPIDVVGLELYLAQDGVLRVEVPLTQETYYFQRVAAMPGSCPIDTDPERNFEAFVTTFNENFAFFPFIDYDWEAAVAEARALVNAETTQEELFDILSALQGPTDDRHGGLESEFASSEPGEPGPYVLDVMQHWQDVEPGGDFDAFLAEQNSLFYEILPNYVSDLKSTANNRILFGKIDEHTGYLLFSMTMGFVPDFGDIFGDQAALEAGLDEVFAELGDLPKLVFDNRWNPGGRDVFAQRIVSRFTDQKRLAYSETGRHGQGFLPWRSHWTKPHPERPAYQGEVVYLTSSNTGSAAEIMTMLMKTLPRVTHLGEPTAGALSDSLGMVLPNGWQVNLSNEIYLDQNGEWHEFRGVPPEIEMPHFPRADREAGRDSLLEAAIAY
ncbi:S41 family peptidase [Acanthopleuribacter pedis]|uniref:S41 family peptidase n=1 Tax=Acanthopleuribacter pedis TaxID=442870 RepID=A0A8J7Q3N0_9BACT|nr:S41 family peptidase [Acanthopleuribacter pedis]MBO1317472.1 S41 family peptidase [Acanthopleuribacter pedis]